MLQSRRLTGLAALLGLSLIGIPVVTAAPATAAGTTVTAAKTPGVPNRPILTMRPPPADLARMASRYTAGMRPASVQPVAQFSPACYGDSRNMTAVGGILDPVSYGAFYNCPHQEWTFEVRTADSWAKNTLGDLVIGIDTTGNFQDGCGGDEYFAVLQQTGTAGQFTAVAGPVSATTCQFVGTPTTGVITITANSAAISFPWSAIGHSSALAWNALLQTRAEEISGTGGDDVPSLTTIDAPVRGAVVDSIPPPGPPNCAASATTTSNQTSTTADSHRAAAALRKAGFRDVHDYGEGIVSFSGDASLGGAVIRAAGLNAQISPNLVRHTEGVPLPEIGATTLPNDPGYASQWNLPVINAPGAWAVTTGNHIVVADVDTGVDFTHPDFSSPQLVPGIDETTVPPSVINYASGDADTNGHGTAVAGVIAAATNNSIGLASLGWNTSVMPIKASSGSTLTDAAIAAGIRFAADNGARIINLSLGGPCPDTTLQSAVTYAQGKNVLVVAAAGNEAVAPGFNPQGQYDYPSYPAAYPGVLAVGATGVDGYRAGYSDTGSYVSLMAPGGGEDTNSDFVPVLQPVSLAGGTGTGYTAEAGTSFASPQVAAAAALILSVNPNLTPSQVTELLTGTATDLGPTGKDIEYGAGLLNASAALADTPPTTTGFGTFASVPPTRILDTRIGLGAPQAKVGPGGVIKLTVTGVGGIPSTGVTALVMNTTVTNATAPSVLTVWPTGQAQPNSSNLNYVANNTLANLVTVKVGSGGQVSLSNSAGSVDLIADVAGYYVDGSGTAGSTFVPLSPFRLLDTRLTGAGGPLAAGTSRDLTVTGIDGVPASASSVVVNVTTTNPTAASFVTVYPEGGAVPTASNVNFVAKQTVPNLATVQLGAPGGVGTPGGLSIYNQAGAVDVIVDLEGYFTQAGDTSGSRFFPLVNHRILDTRANIGGFYGPIGSATAIGVGVVGQGGILDGASAAVINATVTQPTANSFLTVYPANLGSPPNSSNLNYTPGETIANLVSATIGNLKDDFYNQAGTTQAIADVVGWYGPAGS